MEPNTGADGQAQAADNVRSASKPGAEFKEEPRQIKNQQENTHDGSPCHAELTNDNTDSLKMLAYSECSYDNDSEENLCYGCNNSGISIFNSEYCNCDLGQEEKFGEHDKSESSDEEFCYGCNKSGISIFNSEYCKCELGQQERGDLPEYDVSESNSDRHNTSDKDNHNQHDDKQSYACPAHTCCDDFESLKSFSYSATSSPNVRCDAYIHGMMDSGAVPMLMKTSYAFTDPVPARIGINMAENGSVCHSSTRGYLLVKGSTAKTTHQTRALAAETLSNSLISVSELDKSGLAVLFSEGHVMVCDTNQIKVNHIIAKGSMDPKTNLYFIHLPVEYYKNDAAAATENFNHYDEDLSDNECEPNAKHATSYHHLSIADLIHGRIGHLNAGIMKRVIRDSTYKVDFNQSIICMECVKAKCHTHPHSKLDESEKIPHEPGEQISSDIVGPFYPSSESIRYAELFVCVKSRYIVVKLYRRKSEHPKGVSEAILEYNRLSGRSLKIHRTDGCGTMRSRVMNLIYMNSGIEHQMSAPNDSDDNGLAENTVKIVSGGVTTAMIKSGTPPSFTAYCFKAWVFVYNRINMMENPLWPRYGPGKYCSRINLITRTQLPYPLVWIREWGILMIIKCPDQRNQKHGGKQLHTARAFEGVFIGYCERIPNAYLIYDLEDRVIRSVPRKWCTAYDDRFPMRDRRHWPSGDVISVEFSLKYGDESESDDEGEDVNELINKKDRRNDLQDYISIEPRGPQSEAADLQDQTVKVINSKDTLSVESTHESDDKANIYNPDLDLQNVVPTRLKFSPAVSKENLKRDDSAINHEVANPENSLRYYQERAKEQVAAATIDKEKRAQMKEICNSGPPTMRVTRNRKQDKSIQNPIPQHNQVAPIALDVKELVTGKEVYAIDIARGKRVAVKAVVHEVKADGPYLRFIGKNSKNINSHKGLQYGPYYSNEVYDNESDCREAIKIGGFDVIEENENEAQQITSRDSKEPAPSGNQARQSICNNFEEATVDEEIITKEKIPKHLLVDPNGRTEAMKNKTLWPHFYKAEKVEWKALNDLGVIELIDPHNLEFKPRIMKTKWVYKIKFTGDGNVEKFKARLTACGYSQIEGIDFHETFAYVSNIKTLRILLQLWNMDPNSEFEHWDVSNAFCHAEIDEILFMIQPAGHIVKGKEHHILQVKKALYGTRQAANLWFKLVRKIMTRAGASSIPADVATYVIDNKKGGYCVIWIHVDDFGVWFNEAGRTLRDEIWGAFIAEVDIKNMGELKWILQFKVQRDKERGTVIMSQAAYADALVQRYDYLKLREYDTPGPEGSDNLCDKSAEEYREEYDNLSADMQREIREFPFREIVGSLWWLTNITRVDINTSTHQVAKWTSHGSLTLISRIKRILGYLKRHSHRALIYLRPSKNEVCLRQAADASLGNERKGKSTLGNLEWFWGALIHWVSASSSRVALSTSEAETMGLVKGSKINVFTRAILSGFPKELTKRLDKCTTILEDNESAVKLVAEGGKQKFSRHYSMEFYHLKESIALGELAIKQVAGIVNPADFLTKCLGKILYEKYRDELMGNEELQNLYKEIIANAHKALINSPESNGKRLNHFQNEIFESIKTIRGFLTSQYIKAHANTAQIVGTRYNKDWKNYRDKLLVNEVDGYENDNFSDTMTIGACENEKFLNGLYN